MDWLGLAANAAKRAPLFSATVASNYSEQIMHSFSRDKALMKGLRNCTLQLQNTRRRLSLI